MEHVCLDEEYTVLASDAQTLFLKAPSDLSIALRGGGSGSAREAARRRCLAQRLAPPFSVAARVVSCPGRISVLDIGCVLPLGELGLE